MAQRPITKWFHAISDLVGHLSSARTVWKFLEYTNGGHRVAAFIFAVAVSLWGMLREDSVASISVFAVLMFTSVLVGMNVAFGLKSRSRLDYLSICGTTGPFGTEQGGFLCSGHLLRPVFVQINPSYAPWRVRV